MIKFCYIVGPLLHIIYTTESISILEDYGFLRFYLKFYCISGIYSNVKLARRAALSIWSKIILSFPFPPINSVLWADVSFNLNLEIKIVQNNRSDALACIIEKRQYVHLYVCCSICTQSLPVTLPFCPVTSR